MVKRKLDYYFLWAVVCTKKILVEGDWMLYWVEHVSKSLFSHFEKQRIKVYYRPEPVNDSSLSDN